MPFTSNRRYLAANVEVTAGVANAPISADFDTRARNIEYTPEFEFDDESSRFATGGWGEDTALSGVRKGTVSFDIKICDSGDVVTAPNWWKYAEACRMEVKAYTTTGIALQDAANASLKTLTFDIYEHESHESSPDFVVSRLVGCQGNMVIHADAIGGAYMASFTFTGKYVSISDASTALTLTSPDTTLGYVMRSTACTFFTETAKISQFSLDLGNTVEPLIDQSDVTGYSHFHVVDRQPRLSINPLMEKVSVRDTYAQVTTPTISSVSLVNSLNQIFSITIPQAQLMNPSVSDREGLVGWDYTVRCLRNGGSDSDIPNEATMELLIGSRT